MVKHSSERWPGRASRLIGLLLWSGLFLAPASVLACGGLFCSTGPGAAPVDQTGERILFEIEDGRICATVDIQYTGNPEAFAWVVPVPEAPEVSDADVQTLNTLSSLTGLQWVFPAADNEGCPDFGGGSGCGCGDDESGGSIQSGDAIDFPPPVDVLDRQSTGTYDTVTLDALTAADLVGWLDENAFNVSQNMVPAMQPYLDEGMVFLAIKLRANRQASQIRPLRFCYTAAAPQIPLRLTAVAAQPHMNIEVFIASYTLYTPMDAVVAQPDPDALAFNVWGTVNYPAWLARESAQRAGRFWSLEYAGRSPELAVRPPDPPTGPDCHGQPESCPAGTVCTTDAGGEMCLRPCSGGCMEGETCAFGGFCSPRPRLLPPWLTRYRARMSPEHMDHDPLFVATPELGAFDGVVDMSERAPLARCFETLEERLPSPCAFVYCGEGAQCVADNDRSSGQAGCDCPPDQVAGMVEVPGGLLPTCQPRENPVGVTLEDSGDPCATFACGLGECVPVNGFPTCRCHEGAYAYTTNGRLTCARPAGEVTVFDEGATPEAGNRDDAPLTSFDPRRPGLPALAITLLVALGLLRRGRA